MRAPGDVFVDTGAWIALAAVQDPLHSRAKAAWDRVLSSGARCSTSVPVVLETFTFLDRNTTREVALRWKDSLKTVRRLRLLECGAKELSLSWKWFERRDLHRLSAVDATSFVLMEREKIRVALTYDHHFASAGFRIFE